MIAEQVIIKPVISEKSYDNIAISKYTFEVAQEANKIEIKKAVEEVFKVTVLNVNTSHVSAKKKRMGMKMGKTRAWKKAVVTLKPGDKIEFFEAK